MDALPTVEIDTSPDGTERLLLALGDGESVEAVAMPEGDRTAVCISSQVGCPVGCGFCASGLAGFGRNLSGKEMVAQVATVAGRPGLPPPGRVVFMGMGEPLLNVEAVCEAVRAIRERWRIGRKHMRVSTVGIRHGLLRLAREPHPPGLALSLHAVTDELRRTLIPFRAAGSVREAIEAACDYGRDARVRVAIQYVLLAGVNDGPEDARLLRGLCAGRNVKVDVIRFNPVPEVPFERSSHVAEQAFARALYGAGIHVTVRESRGAEARAACGQLRRMGASPGGAGMEARSHV